LGSGGELGALKAGPLALLGGRTEIGATSALAAFNALALTLEMKDLHNRGYHLTQPFADVAG